MWGRSKLRRWIAQANRDAVLHERLVAAMEVVAMANHVIELTDGQLAVLKDVVDETIWRASTHRDLMQGYEADPGREIVLEEIRRKLDS